MIHRFHQWLISYGYRPLLHNPVGWLLMSLTAWGQKLFLKQVVWDSVVRWQPSDGNNVVNRSLLGWGVIIICMPSSCIETLKAVTACCAPVRWAASDVLQTRRQMTLINMYLRSIASWLKHKITRNFFYFYLSESLLILLLPCQRQE